MTETPNAIALTVVRLPRPTPTSSATADAGVSAAPATEAAAKSAAHDAIVSGFDAVAGTGLLGFAGVLGYRTLHEP